MVPPPRQHRLAWVLWQRGDVWRMLAKALPMLIWLGRSSAARSLPFSPVP